MKELSAQYPRYGYRRIRIFLGRDGYRMSPGRAHRLWRAAGLQVPRKRPRKRLAAARPRPQGPCGPNQVWSYGHCANGQQLKWRPGIPAQRQWTGVRIQGTVVLDRRARYRHGVDQAGQALAEWCHGKLQRQVPRRVPEPRVVPFAGRGEGDHRSMAAALQRITPAFEHGASAPRPVAQPSPWGQMQPAREAVST
jgi:transposase InsO family protein